MRMRWKKKIQKKPIQIHLELKQRTKRHNNEKRFEWKKGERLSIVITIFRSNIFSPFFDNVQIFRSYFFFEFLFIRHFVYFSVKLIISWIVDTMHLLGHLKHCVFRNDKNNVAGQCIYPQWQIFCYAITVDRSRWLNALNWKTCDRAMDNVIKSFD